MFTRLCGELAPTSLQSAVCPLLLWSPTHPSSLAYTTDFLCPNSSRLCHDPFSLSVVALGECRENPTSHSVPSVPAPKSLMEDHGKLIKSSLCYFPPHIREVCLLNMCFHNSCACTHISKINSISVMQLTPTYRTFSSGSLVWMLILQLFKFVKMCLKHIQLQFTIVFILMYNVQ